MDQQELDFQEKLDQLKRDEEARERKKLQLVKDEA